MTIKIVYRIQNGVAKLNHRQFSEFFFFSSANVEHFGIDIIHKMFMHQYSADNIRKEEKEGKNAWDRISIYAYVGPFMNGTHTVNVAIVRTKLYYSVETIKSPLDSAINKFNKNKEANAHAK